MIKKLLCALILGIVCLLLIAQNDAWVKQVIADSVKNGFEKNFGATFVATIDSINFFSPSCEFVNVFVEPIDHQDWKWQAKRLTLQFSWLNFLLHRSIGLQVAFENIEMWSAKRENRIAIWDHVRLFFTGVGTIPIVIKSISLNPASLTIPSTLFLKWHSESKKLASGFKSQVYCLDGTISVANKDYIENIAGTFGFESTFVGVDGSYNYSGSAKLSCATSYLSEKKEDLFIAGAWENDIGSCVIKNSDQSINVQLSDLHKSDAGIIANVQANVPVKNIVRWCLLDTVLTGTGYLQGSIKLSENGLQAIDGELVVEDCAWDEHCFIKKIVSSLHKNGSKWHGDASLFADDQVNVVGSWQWEEQSGVAHCASKIMRPIFIPGMPDWCVDAQNSMLTIEKDESGDVSGVYRFDIVHAPSTGSGRPDFAKASTGMTGEQALVVGSFSTACQPQGVGVDIAGHFNDYAYEVSGLLTSGSELCASHITKLVCADKTGKRQVNLEARVADTPALQGTVDIDFIKTIASNLFGYQLNGQGVMNLDATYNQSNRTIATQIHFVDSVIRVPHLYNFITGFDAEIMYDFSNKKIDLQNMCCLLDRGSIICNSARFVFDDTYRLSFAHVPITLRECLINVNKDLFALISAQLLCTKKRDVMPSVQGALIVERSQCKENIFSEMLQKKIFQSTERALNVSGADMACDVTIETAAPVHVETAFLETNARVAVAVTNTIRNPVFSGSINLNSGSLHFPYKSLQITKGSLHCVPNQLYDPIIELVAKNKIKKYNVSLTVTGSLQNHHIMLESSPPLTEEQIIALLLIGSQEESLNIVMPALIMNNLTTLLFGDTQSRDSLDSFFKRLFKPFDNVHLVPSFTDQTGRGGLRGAIEIDVTDRWHALIQKNFSLSEDTRLELEYLLSDDVTVRGIRNERRDIGGEVEMRWKF